MNEIEIKILDIDVEVIRAKALKLNMKKVKVENQINNIYDFKDNSLHNNKGYARIRLVEDKLTNTNHVYMTTKKLISQEKYKVMAEHEIEISDAKEGENIFKALGLELIRSVKKYRESYKYKDTLIEIDINDTSFFPFPYIEIESSIESEMLEVINLLGYTIKDTTSKTIGEILKEKGVVKDL